MTPLKRFLRFIFLILVGLMLAVVIVFSAGFLQAAFFEHFQETGWPYILSTLFLGHLAQLMTSLLLTVTAGFAWLSFRAQRNSVRIEEANEEESYLAYRSSFRYLEYASLTFNLSGASLLFAIVIGARQLNEENLKSSFEVPLGQIVLLLLVQFVIWRLTRQLRDYKISVFPSSKEVRDMIQHYDEGELQAHYVQSFETLFNLRQYVIPSLYIILMIVAYVSPLSGVSGFIILLVIHFYVNLSSFKMIRQYFK
ncbi:hypothetical protein STRDD10_00673 [Streptococcus sp. DD10]|uniref:DUF3169 family protein n=1 Tax=Streptococcus sp. DD10 TaxID=1777878 RepID=UPI00079CD0BA|nr:DUF3169 family protein [Streptococcus sp. DD10]KXT74833.1 hypothetical protein STRDD10_00673 [Streptococcus sp. DD10]